MDNSETLDTLQGRIQDFKLGGGGTLKKIVPSRGVANIFGVFRVKNHDFMPKNHIFSNFGGGVAPPAGSAPALDAQDTRQRQTKQKNITQKTNKMNKLYKNVVRCLCITKQN